MCLDLRAVSVWARKEMTNTIRSFIAIELPEEITETIRKIAAGFRRYKLNIRWVRPENVHLTLKFLGEISQDDVEPITDALMAAAERTGAIRLMAQGIGVFPGIKRPRVVWIGVGGDVVPLREFQLCIEQGLEPFGFPREKRPFRAHLTVGRVKGNLDKNILLQAIERLGHLETDPFTARSVVLFRSDLRKTGAVYTKLMEVPFG